MSLYSKICFFLYCLFFIACTEEDKPQSLAPVVTVEEAQEISRTTALITGKVETVGQGVVNTLRFRYGISAEMTEERNCPVDELPHPQMELTGLTPGSTYYFCLEAGNGSSTVRSQTLSFTTLPNERPSMGEVQMLSQGPISIILQYELTDNGGEPITDTGCYYRAENGEEQQLSLQAATIAQTEKQVFKIRISGLQTHTAYTVQTYATNSIGETRSTKFNFRTNQAVILTTPGILPETIGEEEKFLYSSLSFAGPLNGTDLRFLREMMGRDLNEGETPGQINTLDLTDASIVEGGLSYNATRYAETGTIGYALFKGCRSLQKLRLPENTRIIEENAFEDCTGLTSLSIPSQTLELTPSKGCTSLKQIEVSKANDTFCSRDGILYDKEYRRLIWFPEGKTEAFEFPASIEYLEDYAFRNCHIARFELPAGIKEMGKGVFHASEAEEVVLPEKLKLLPYATFQQCGKLTSVTLGEELTMISEYCFDGCPLQNIYSHAMYPPVCQPESFAGAGDKFQTCILHVPKGSKELYRASETWGKFKTIVEL